MKKSLILFVVLCGGVVCAIVLFGRLRTSSATESAVESIPAPVAPPPEEIATTKPELPPTIPTKAIAPERITPATSVVAEAAADDAAQLIKKGVDALLSTKNGPDKHAAFQQLIKDGQLDAAIAELKQRMVEDPGNVKLPTTLGEALLNKVRMVKEAGGDVNEMGILAMQADQSFNAALKIDPKNWEASFVKASSMYYWPANEQRDNEVAQRLSGLIDQQETMPPNPAFAQTYLVLGNQFQKMGQMDKALGTWQLGLQKFPGDPALLKKISGR